MNLYLAQDTTFVPLVAYAVDFASGTTVRGRQMHRIAQVV